METNVNATSTLNVALCVAFNQACSNAKQNPNFVSIEFNPEWHNGTGYFDRANYAVTNVPIGKIGYCTDEKGRRILIVPGGLFTEEGEESHPCNIVYFDRYPLEAVTCPFSIDVAIIPVDGSRVVASCVAWDRNLDKLFEATGQPVPAGVNGLFPYDHPKFGKGYAEAEPLFIDLVTKIVSGEVKFKEHVAA